MKKNKMMRLASSLLVAVLLTTSVISGTFAKYVTSDNAGDQAKVAKFGVVVNVSGTEAFANKYKVGELTATNDEAVASVWSKTNDTLAPGTTGNLANVVITGNPEVSVEIKAEVDLKLTNWEIETGVTYFPVKITVGSTAVTYDAGTSLATIEASVEEAIAQAIVGNGSFTPQSGSEKAYATKVYAPNTSFTAANNTTTVTWVWDYEGDNAKDTKLGSINSEIEFTCVVTVTQIN